MKNRFQKWLHEKYIDFCSRSSRRRTLTEFADYIGLKNPTLNQWMVGRAKARREMLFALWRLYGTEVYDVCGFDVPEYVRLIELADEYLSLEQKREISRRAAQPPHPADGRTAPLLARLR